MLLAVSAMPLSAQVKSGSITVSARDNVVNKLPKDVVYVFSDFADATLNYNNGRFSVGCLNIRLLDNFILYIDDKTSDTLVLSNPNQVRNLVCNDTVYRIVNNSVVKVLSDDGGRQLAQRLRLELDEKDADAGYSSLPPTSTAVTSNVRRLDPSRNLDTEKDYIYKYERDFVLVDVDDKVYPVKISSFNRLFPDKKKEIKAYVKENKVNFGSQSDLIALFGLCVSD